MLFEEQFIHNVIQARNQAFQALNAVQPMINDIAESRQIAAEQVALLFAPQTWPQVPTPARRRLPRKAVNWIMMRFTHVR